MTKTELLEKAQTDKRTQPLIIDFYNLHLESGPKYDRSKMATPIPREATGRAYRETPPYESMADVELVYPDDNEQNRITEFIEENVPNLGEEFRQYQERTGKNWFVSKHFMRFAYDYGCTRELIHEYALRRRAPRRELLWLASRIAERRHIPTLELISRKDGVTYHTFPCLDIPNTGEFLNIDEYEFGYHWKRLDFESPAMPYYGIRLESLWYIVIGELAKMLQEKWDITKCQAEDCDNVLLQEELGRRRLYCSDTCRYRVNQRKWRMTNCTTSCCRGSLRIPKRLFV